MTTRKKMKGTKKRMKTMATPTDTRSEPIQPLEFQEFS
jgi:hypothetical protein